MTQSIGEFVEHAKSYCSLIEHLDDFTTEDFLARVRENLPLLYHHALSLPDLKPADDEINSEISHEKWSDIFGGLVQKLGINDLYWKIYDPIKADLDEPGAGSLSDDLADIWRDLKDGLLNWDNCSDSMRNETLWEWHFSFHTHWSYHLVDALQAIQWILECYGIREFDDED